MSTIPPLPTTVHPSASLEVDARHFRIHASIVIQASADRVFAIWADVAHWHTWDPDTRWARLDGAPVAGTQGKLAPRQGLPVGMVLRTIHPPSEFTVECTVLGSRMVFPHRLVRLDHGVRVTHTVEFHGWLKGMLMRSVGKQVVAGLPLTLSRLKALAERGENAVS